MRRAEALLLVLAMGTALAEQLPDPTRPSNVQLTSSRDAPSSDEATLQVQMISISTKRRFAIIDGQEVGVGSTIGKGRVLGINENEVVLDLPSGRKVLPVYSWKNGTSTPPPRTVLSPVTAVSVSASR